MIVDTRGTLTYVRYAGTENEEMVDVPVEVVDKDRWYARQGALWEQYTVEAGRVRRCDKRDGNDYWDVGMFIEFQGEGS